MLNLEMIRQWSVQLSAPHLSLFSLTACLLHLLVLTLSISHVVAVWKTEDCASEEQVMHGTGFQQEQTVAIPFVCLPNCNNMSWMPYNPFPGYISSSHSSIEISQVQETCLTSA